MSDWQLSILKQQIDGHLALSATGTLIAVVTPEARKRYGTELEAAYRSTKRLSFADLGAERSLVETSNPAAVVLISGSLPESRQAYARLNWIKDRGVPVVFAMPERRLAEGPPSWERAGVQYEGMFWLAAQYAATIRPTKGAYCEFGVYDGRTFALACHALKNVCSHFHAFDSFQGIGGSLPDEQGHFKDGQYYANVETFHYNMKFCSLDATRITAHPGYFDDTLKGRVASDDGIDAISVVHIDTDVYAPALQALDYVAPVLSDGALVLFDDYDQLAASNARGERRAFREWLAKTPTFEAEPYRNYAIFGRSFIVHRVA